jgi:hypothetical protein
MAEKTKGALLPPTWPKRCTNRAIETYLMLQDEISYNSHRQEAMIYGRRRAVAWKPLAGG